MKVVILAGGFGSRLSEETDIRPKPMVEIGGKPIIWHIMKIYSSYGFNEFIILLGYKGYVIKEYFSNYFLHQSDVTIDIVNNSIETHQNQSEPWKVTLLETGLNTMTGGRIKQVKKYINNETFMMTYGDGVSNVNINELLNYHTANGKKITMTAVQPEGRYGALTFDENDLVTNFMEKPQGDGLWINGGFFVCEPSILDAIDNDSTVFEQEPLNKLAIDNELVAFKHHDFWRCMDTIKDKGNLNEMWGKNNAPWKIWD